MAAGPRLAGRSHADGPAPLAAARVRPRPHEVGCPHAACGMTRAPDIVTRLLDVAEEVSCCDEGAGDPLPTGLDASETADADDAGRRDPDRAGPRERRRAYRGFGRQGESQRNGE